MESAFLTLWFTILGVIIGGATGAIGDASSILPTVIQAFLGFFFSLIGG